MRITKWAEQKWAEKKWTKKWTWRLLPAIGLLLAAATTQAASCPVATLDTYTASGFSCTLGTLQFRGFSWSSNLSGNVPGTVNLPGVINVAPQNGAGGTGFQFSNLGVSFSGTLSNVVSDVFFDAASLSGTITGAYLAIGAHTGVGPEGTAVAYFQDSLNAFVLTVADPLIIQNQFYPTVRTSDSSIFPGVTADSFFSGGAAVVNGFNGGSGTVGDYTVLLSTTDLNNTAVPEPSTLVTLPGILFALAALRRRIPSPATRAAAHMPDPGARPAPPSHGSGDHGENQHRGSSPSASAGQWARRQTHAHKIDHP